MSDQRCKNCKHWDNDIYLHGVKHPYGSCMRFKMPHEINVGGLSFFADPESVLDEHPAYVEDGSDYHAALRCGPEFGCVLFEAKEQS